MRKLTAQEQSALDLVARRGSFCPGVAWVDSSGLGQLVRCLDSLVKKRRLTVEMTDDGPRYHAA